MRTILVMVAFSCTSLCIGCATTNSEQSVQTADEAAPAGSGKQSLDKLLDEHDKVTLVDDETGETRLICRHLPVTGSRLGGEKVCATKKQWEDSKRESQENVGDTQRRITQTGKSN